MIYVLLTARDEEHPLARLLGTLRDLSSISAETYRVLVVDDGSLDDTRLVVRSFARSLDLTLVRHASSLGAGAALRSGVRLVLAESGDPDDLLVTLAADGSHDPSLIPELARALRRGGVDVAVASRYVGRGGEERVSAPGRLRAAVKAAFRRMLIHSGGVRDVRSGFRICRVGALRAASAAAAVEIPVEAGPGAGIELLARLRRNGASVVEVPFLLRLPSGRGRIKAESGPRGVSRATAPLRMGRPATGF